MCSCQLQLFVQREEEKLEMGVGEEQVFCFEHVNFEVPIRNSNGSLGLDIQVYISGERSRLEKERSHQCVRESIKLKLDEITKGIRLDRKKKN